MATSRRSRPGFTAFSVAVGLLVLALMLIASSPAWYGSDPAQRTMGAAAGVWTPGAWMAPSSTAPATAVASEQPPAFWRLRHPATSGAANQPSFRMPAWPDPGAIGSPQQTAHRTAGSRSPPAI
ncbi:hypothetical protein ACFHYQ_07390 [Sphaerimonospora cavernae]|uniref:Uncharacterized protein n=1 Tax=Sphaerimonospora cavernae TaxID=1740611 RepID=A0ABV6U2A6_9ACTN